MLEVKIYDGDGNLKQELSRETVLAKSNENFDNAQRINTRNMTFKKYTCIERDCLAVFESNSTRGAKYCPRCRSGAYRRSKRRKIEEKRKEEEERKMAQL